MNREDAETLSLIASRPEWEEVMVPYLEKRMRNLQDVMAVNDDHITHLKLIGRFSELRSLYDLKSLIEEYKHSDSSPS